MKKWILIIAASILIFFELFPQTSSDDCIDAINKYFIYGAEDIDSSTEKFFRSIPVDTALKIFGNEIVDKEVQGVKAEFRLNFDVKDIYIIELGYPTGGTSAISAILTLTEDCLIEKIEFLGSTTLDAFGGNICCYNLVMDSILEVEKCDLTFDEEGVEDNCNIESYYILNNKGFQRVLIKGVSKNRNFPGVSYRIYNQEELKALDRNELDIMRNEIFADHGYIFKTEKWQEYFKEKDWYNPRYEDVSDKLSVIEKINIENILKVAPLR